MDYQQIRDYIMQQGATDNAGRDRTMYNVPGLSSAVQVLPNGQFNYADPNRPGFNRMGTGAPTDYSYEQKNGLDPDFVKFALASGLMATGLGTGLLGGSSGAGAAAAGEAGGTGLGGLGGAMGQAGDYGMGALAGDAGVAAGTAAGTAAATTGGVGSTLGSIGTAAKGLLGNAGGVAALGGLLGGLGSKGPDSQTTTNQNKMDPRMDTLVYGTNGQNGYLGKVMGLLGTPQSPGMSQFGGGMDAYLGQYGRGEFDNDMRAAGALRDTRFNAPQMQAAQVQAPGQNSLNLAPAYQDMIYSDPGANPYLTGSIQKGINQSNNAFQGMLSDATRNLTENILPGIRSGSIVNGTFGGSRQGIAEGRALNTFNDSVGRAMSQFGQNNTDSAIAAQAGSYNAGRDRALSAMGGLGGQQYGVAGQNAQFQQQSNLSNMGSQMDTNRLNMDNLKSGVGLSSGLLGNAYNYGTNQDQYAGQKVGQVGSLLSPFTGLNASQQQTQPLYHNTAGGILGGITTGLGLWNSLGKGQ